MVYICVVRPNDSIPTIIITFGDGSTQPLTYVLMGWVVEPELSMVELDIRRSISHFGWYIAVLSARWHTNPFTDLYALIGKRETAQLNDLVGRLCKNIFAEASGGYSWSILPGDMDSFKKTQAVFQEHAGRARRPLATFRGKKRVKKGKNKKESRMKRLLPLVTVSASTNLRP